MNERGFRHNIVLLSDVGVCLVVIYYIWFITPFLRTVFSGNIANAFFLAILLLGLIFIVFTTDYPFEEFKKTMAIPILFYLLFFIIMVILQFGNAPTVIKAIVPFCLTGIVEALAFSKERNAKWLKILIACLAITYITTIIALINNSDLSRLITSSNTESEVVTAISMKNVGTIGFIEALMLLAPLFIKNVMQNKKRWLNLALWLALLLLAIKASFTITLIIFIFFSLLAFFVFSKKIWLKALVVFLLLIGIIIINESFLRNIINLISNDMVANRLERIINAFYDNNAEELGSRYTLYMESLKTFINNPFGVGPYYFVKGKGIGNHSAILDFLARFGIFALAFLIIVFVKYYRYLSFKWGKGKNNLLILIIIFEYLVFLLLNPGFRFECESVIVLLILPNINSIFAKQKDNLL